MRVAVRYTRADAAEFLSPLARVFGDYGIEIVCALGDAAVPVPDELDAVVVLDRNAPAESALTVSEFTEDAARRAAIALVGDKHFETFSTYGVAAEEIARRAKGLGKRNIAVFVRRTESGARVCVRYGDRAAKVDVDGVCDAVRNEFADCIYAERDCEIESALVARLIETERRIAVAESFTGGGITSRLTRVAGASKAVSEGIVAYTEAAKIDRLGVEAQTIAFHSAVSFNAAYQMAAGLLRTGRADVVVATTGYAGPTGQDVGKCFIAVGDAKRINIFEYNFAGTREEITDKGIRAALDRLADFLFVKAK